MRRKIFPGKPLLSVIIAYGMYFLTGCSGHSKNDAAIIKMMEESLNRSNKSLNYSTQSTLHELNEKQFEASTAARAKNWYPKADRIVTLCQAYYKYIEALKRQGQLLRKESNTLYATLKKMEPDIFATDSLLKNAFSNTTGIFTDSIIATEDYFYKIFFKNTSDESSRAFLTELQNRIKNLELKTVTFCNEQIGSTDGEGFFTSYSFIVGQNYKVLNQGTQLEITAGVGAFSTASNPEIKINGIPVDINESGYCVYKKKINKSPGNYSLPIQISYTDQDGKKQIITKTLEYTVAKECDQ